MSNQRDGRQTLKELVVGLGCLLLPGILFGAMGTCGLFAWNSERHASDPGFAVIGLYWMIFFFSLCGITIVVGILRWRAKK